MTTNAIFMVLRSSDIGLGSYDPARPPTQIGVISANPLFVNANGLNFHLKTSAPSSPCWNTANAALIGPDFLDIDDNPATTVLPLDLALVNRNQGGVPDMGAYEQ